MVTPVLYFEISFFNDILYQSADAAFITLVKLIHIDRLAVFQYDMGLLDPWDVIFEDLPRVVDTHRNDCTARLLCNLKAAVMEFQKGVIHPVAGSLRENTDGDTGLYLIDGCQDGLHTGFDIGSVQEYTVQIFHPGIQGRNAEYFNLGHIAGETRYADIGNQDVEVASVVSDVQDGFVLGHIFLADHSHSGTGKEQNHPEGPFDDG